MAHTKNKSAVAGRAHIVPERAGASRQGRSFIMKPRLIGAEQQDIDDRIRAHGLDPDSFAYRVQASDCITRYVRTPARMFGKHVQAEALALYPKDHEYLYITFEHDPRCGFRSSFCPSLNDDLRANVQTWQELMGLLDQWLERLTGDTGLLGKRTERPTEEESSRGNTALPSDGKS